MSFFNGARNVQVSGGQFIANIQNGSFLQYLREYISAGSIHDSAVRFSGGPPSRCMPGTRKSTLAAVRRWLNDPLSPSKVLWLSGAAGSGKSAVAQTVCEELELDGRFFTADFFFSRSSVGSSSAVTLFSTISYQLAVLIPSFRDTLFESLERDSTLVTKASAVQLQSLIVEPLLKAVNASEQSLRGCVVIIDGLDECENETSQCRIIQELVSVLERADLPARFLKFIITSRPDPWIRDEFRKSGSLVYSMPLDHTDEVNKDILAYYKKGFRDIRRRTNIAGRLGEEWPSSNDLSTLVYHASGQFIYAATVLKFVGDPDSNPLEQLRIILNIPRIPSPSEHPFDDLDKLYFQILTSIRNKQRTLDVLGALIAVINVLSTTKSGLSQLSLLPPSNRTSLLDIVEDLLQINPGDSALALRRLHALISIPENTDAPVNEADLRECLNRLSPDAFSGHNARTTTTIPALGLPIKFHHQTFPDFLLDSVRSKDYALNIFSFHERIALSSLKLLSHPVLEDQGLYIPGHTDEVEKRAKLSYSYSIDRWSHHVIACKELPESLCLALQDLDLCSSILPVELHENVSYARNALRKKLLDIPVPSWLLRLVSPDSRQYLYRHFNCNVDPRQLDWEQRSSLTDLAAWLVSRPGSEVPLCLKEKFCISDNFLTFSQWNVYGGGRSEPSPREYWCGIRTSIRNGHWDPPLVASRTWPVYLRTIKVKLRASPKMKSEEHERSRHLQEQIEMSHLESRSTQSEGRMPPEAGWHYRSQMELQVVESVW